MFAVIFTGGKQYLVKEGDTLRVEKLDAENGSTFEFDKVLLTATEDGSDVKLGAPFIEGSKVIATIEEQGRAKKIRVVKFKRKIRYKRVFGHRQPFTKIKIASIA